MSEQALTAVKMARRGGLARARNMTAEARKAQSRKAYLAGAVRSVFQYRDQLTEEQRDLLFDACSGQMLHDRPGAGRELSAGRFLAGERNPSLARG